MTNRHSKRELESVAAALDSFGRGLVAISDLPVTSVDFWSTVLALSARAPRRVRRRASPASVAQRLVSQVLPPDASRARREAAVTAVRADDVRVRRTAVLALRGSAVESEKALALAAEDRDAEVRLLAVQALAEGKSASSYTALARVVQFSRALAGTVAAEALVQAGPAAMPALLHLLDSEDDRARWRAIDCLTRIGTKDALPALLRGFHDASQDVAWRAADGLLSLGPDVRIDVLRSVIQRPLGYSTLVALRHYAEHASPRTIFGPIFEATIGLAARPATLTAVDAALEALRAAK